MLFIITYDVNTTSLSGKKRLAKISKECRNYGQRVQNSVFECDMNSAKYVEVKTKLLKIIDAEKDSLRIYNLGNDYSVKIEQYGNNKCYYDPEGELII